MRYLTDRKRAQGMGAGGSGTQGHWRMMVRSMIMVVLVPLFLIALGKGIGGSYQEVLAYFSRPIPVIIVALALIVGLIQLMHEAQEAIEDYVHGVAEKLTIVATQAFCYTLIAASLLALIKLAL
ncbi:succinate dehydrogenase, hydrophobic membrane anchor protein [uncultured Ruegeria sp.]|uniref:succinate dehydrogenase, hydrophobic membrane anchor protein n=1 Tax=uncultured Ruegeria sp. TaxID=259304 RepID=UPI002601CE16|nr:succinate dehydrogenase, hydrophobic membrane anchor protein [uncultured Ruegeria sp.]